MVDRLKTLEIALSQASYEKGKDLFDLTPSEVDVLAVVADGGPTNLKRIAGELKLSRSTIHNRLRVVYEKMDVNNKTQAVVAAIRSGIV